MDYEYFRVEESEQFSFFRIPKALFTEKEFEGLSTDAKLLYGILLDRINLSKKNGWVDADGYVYIIYTVAELQEVLNMSHTTVTKLLRELDSVHGIGLIERYRQGCNRPSMIYVKNFVKRIRAKPAVYYPSGTQEICCPERKNLAVRNAKNLLSGTQKNGSPECKNFATNNTDINKTDKNDTDRSKSRSSEKESTCLYGRFGNVRLSVEENRELRKLYPYDFQRMIDQLSAYMKSTGKTYQDHFATILLWAGREELKTGSGRYDFEEGESL